ncbi:hypothetical protein ACKAMS_24920 [Rhodococcus sp. 5A-K4]|uniref:hypothetical protein n=1 Tax=Rhodococcus sp. 5A-K4 TaxID=3384442 RepID=UPI0038D48877
MTDVLIVQDLIDSLGRAYVSQGHFVDSADLPAWLARGYRLDLGTAVPRQIAPYILPAGGVPRNDLSADVQATLAAADHNAAVSVVSVAGRIGAVTLAVTDVAGAAPTASPTFTGVVTVPGLTLAGATPATGQVLTADSSGVGRWASPAAATTVTFGAVQLAGDLGGTAAAPTVPGLASKAPTASPTFTGTATFAVVKVTTGAAAGKVLTSDSSGVASWANPATATSSTPGTVQLAGDLGGTATAPTVPALATKADLVGGIIPQAQLPAIAVTDFLGAPATQTAMLALVGQRGDWCTRTDKGTDWQVIAEPSSVLANWREKTYPASPVSSVAGRVGAVTLSVADVSGAAPTASPTFTGVVTTPAVKVTGGTPAVGSVLTSDASGNGTWTAPAAGTSDATTTSKGVVQLAGDLGGTAAAPTVPGLAGKAPTASPTFTGVVTTPAVKVTGGTPAVGSVLTSDASGNGTWAAPSLAVPVTRILAYTNGGQGGNGVFTTPTSGTITQLGLRHVVHIPVATNRWRIKIRNYSTFDAAAGAQPLTGQGIIFGDHAPDSLGQNTGNFAGSTASTIVSGTFTVPNSTSFYVGPWVTDPALQFTPTRTAVVGWGFTCTAQTLTGGVGEVFQLSTSAAGINPATTGGASGSGSSYKGCPVDFQIEYESTSTKGAWLVIADSIGEGGTGVKGTSYSTTCRPCPPHLTYPARWAASAGTLVHNIAQFNTTTAQWAATSDDRWTRTDMSNANFTGAIIALGSNDMANGSGVSLATYQTNMATIVAKVRTIIGSTAPIYGVNVMGRVSLGTANQTLRQAYNDWLGSVPLGMTDVIDMDSAMTNAGTYTLDANLTMDGVHPSYTGISAMASKLRSVIQT